jgi:hypothetical protein
VVKVRKSKSKAVLRTRLQPDQQAQLALWLIGGLTYRQAIEKINAEFGLQLGSGGLKQLSHFWRDVCSPQILAQNVAANPIGPIETLREEISALRRDFDNFLSEMRLFLDLPTPSREDC